MVHSIRSLTRLSLAALLGALATFASVDAKAASTCDPNAASNCSVGTAANLSGKIATAIPTPIDTGWMEKGSVKVRALFTVAPIGSDPLVKVDMSKGGLVEASWTEKGFVNVKPITAANSEGGLVVHYGLQPSLQAQIYGVPINYDASELLQYIPGSAFNSDVSVNAPLAPWGFAAAQAQAPAPSLDSSTLFSVDFQALGVDYMTAEGTLGLQAATSPTIKYQTKKIELDGAAITAADGSAKIPVVDGDAMDIPALVSGEVTFTGSLDVRPVVTLDSVAGVSTFGATVSFSVVSKTYGGTPMPVTFQRMNIHVPLPNVHAPSNPLDMGITKGGASTEKSVTVDNTGEMGATLSFTSSDPQFTVPSGSVKVDAKGKYDLKVLFSPNSDGPAAADIKVVSNDPDSPEQVFHVAANGAKLDPNDPSSPESGAADKAKDEADSGCACSSTGASSNGVPGSAALALGVGLTLLARRRRR